jgi:Mn2+/Fe2+ NRAMP family transporter
MSGGAKFVVGVPITVLMWVLLPCLGWEAVRKVAPSEKLRKAIIIGGVAIFVVVIMLVVKGFEPLPPPPS